MLYQNTLLNNKIEDLRCELEFKVFEHEYYKENNLETIREIKKEIKLLKQNYTNRPS